MDGLPTESSDGITRAPASAAIIGGAEGERWGDDMEQLLLEMGPDDGDNLLQEAVRWGNVFEAYRRVKGNKGAPGPDGMTVEALGELLPSRWPEIQASLESGTYQPSRTGAVALRLQKGMVGVSESLVFPTSSTVSCSRCFYRSWCLSSTPISRNGATGFESCAELRMQSCVRGLT